MKGNFTVKPWLMLAVASVLLCLRPLSAQEALRVSAFVEPASGMVGQKAVYVVEISNSRSTPDLPAPEVDGLEFASNASVSSSQQFINGAFSSQIRLSWTFMAMRQGSFVIPGRTVEIRGQSYRIPDVRYNAAPMDDRMRDMLFMELDLPEKPLFVGEFVPMAVRLFVRKDLSARLASPIRKSGDAFLQKDFPENPSQRTEARNGILYDMVSWQSIVVPIRAGTDSLEYSVQLIYGDPSRTTRDFFGRAVMTQQEILLTTGPQSIAVEEPPQANRPASFRDAIGTFEVEGALSSRSVQAGEPITLTLKVSGRGNFERISTPVIDETPGWRIYPPKSSFESDDPLAWEGRKTFEFILIPESEMVSMVPGVSFSYFDPTKLEYVETVIEPEAIEVKPAPEGSLAARDFTSRADAAEAGPREDDRALLRPIHTDAGRWVSSLRPAIQSPLYLALNGVAALGLCTTIFVRRRILRLRNDDRYARLLHGSKSVRAWVQKAAEAARTSNAVEFYHAAQRAIQESVAKDLGRAKRAESLLVEDVRSALETRGVSPETIQAVTNIFETTDSLKFAGAGHANDDLPSAHRALVSTLQAIDSRK